MKLPHLILSFALIATIAAPCAYAQANDGPREACKQDAQTLCKAIQPGGGRILDCLKDHYKQLSDGCYQTLQGMASHSDRHSPPNVPPNTSPSEPPTPAGMQDEPPPPSEDDGSDQN